jgi:hypothetical protein
MSAILNAKINLDAIPEESIFQGKKGRYVDLAIFINDESKFGNNVSFQKPLTKEERDAKAEKTFYGNGKVVWVSDEGITVAEKGDDLPF